jgi:hypothetical protein
MQAWVEVPEGWGWGPVRTLRGRLEDEGSHTEEYRTTRGVMIQLTGQQADLNRRSSSLARQVSPSLRVTTWP